MHSITNYRSTRQHPPRTLHMQCCTLQRHLSRNATPQQFLVRGSGSQQESTAIREKDSKRRRFAGKANTPKAEPNAEQPEGSKGVKSEPMDCPETRAGSSKLLDSKQSQVTAPPGPIDFSTYKHQRRQDADLVLKCGLSDFTLLYFTVGCRWSDSAWSSVRFPQVGDFTGDVRLRGD